MNKQRIAVVRVRGGIHLSPKQEDTLRNLRLHRKNYCIIIEDTPDMMGMVKIAKDFVTWGPIDEATLKLLIDKRQEKTKGKDGKIKEKPFFRLQPPRKGFGRKGIKETFSNSGALGNRGEKINDLIQRMI